MNKKTIPLLMILERLRNARTMVNGVEVEGFLIEDIKAILPENTYSDAELPREVNGLEKKQVLKRSVKDGRIIYQLIAGKGHLENIIGTIGLGNRKGRIWYDVEAKDDALPEGLGAVFGSEALVKDRKKNRAREAKRGRKAKRKAKRNIDPRNVGKKKKN